MCAGQLQQFIPAGPRYGLSFRCLSALISLVLLTLLLLCLDRRRLDYFSRRNCQTVNEICILCKENETEDKNSNVQCSTTWLSSCRACLFSREKHVCQNHFEAQVGRIFGRGKYVAEYAGACPSPPALISGPRKGLQESEEATRNPPEGFEKCEFFAPLSEFSQFFQIGDNS